MKTARFFSIMMLCGLGASAATPTENTTLVAKVGIAPSFNGIINLNTLSDNYSYQHETFFVKTDQPSATFSRKLVAATQIIYLNGCALLTNAGDQVKLEIVPLYKNGNPVPGRFRLACNGKDGSRQVLPYKIDSLYGRAAAEHFTTTKETDEFISTTSAQVAELITAAKVNREDNLEALKAFEQYRQLLVRIDVATANKTPDMKIWGGWCLKGFDLSASGLKAIGDESTGLQVQNLWCMGRKMQDSTLTDQQLLVEVLMTCKADRIKERAALAWMVREGMYKAYTPDLKFVYEATQGVLKNMTPGKRAIDSVYNAYKQLEPGQPAFNFALKNDKGDLVRLSDFKGKIVIIDVWAMWCHGCVAALPIFKQIGDSYKDKKDIVFLTIAWEEPGTANAEVLRKFSIDHHIDGENNLFLSSDRSDPQAKQFIQRYALNAITRWIAIDDKGNILEGNLGYPVPGLESEFARRIANCYKARN
ncbi:redoxin family protein [Chitinophaga polysaccharea]|uniref:redoxin family protein n=1 Tax=Chitinophaga TaxID=79328 RepID=UPI0014557A24|nr:MULTISPECIES: redoxin family protein [Chitinophaga]NLR57581.1 redoxin family protein [Chitinophaga polysaccharea]NLU95495.1 redoxin family protein [Chitinophaga sp. Ak27]